MANSVKPFQIHVPEEVLNDLFARIKNTRWPGEITDSDWDYGSNLAYVKELCDYWVESFSWSDQEERLNKFPQFTTDVSGLNIHFIHQKGVGPVSYTHLRAHET